VDALSAVQVMRDAHAPADNRVLRTAVNLCNPPDLLPIHTGFFNDPVPRNLLHVSSKVGKTFGVTVNERRIVRLRFEHLFGDACEQCEVTADVRLHVHAGNVRAEEQTADVTGHTEVLQPQLLQRIDHNHLTATTTQLHERTHEPRVVGCRIRTNQAPLISLSGKLQRPVGLSHCPDSPRLHR
jgi:hypothetical protein